MRFRRKQEQTTYTFNICGQPVHTQPGSSITMPAYGITIWANEDGVFDILPQMSEEQMDARVRGEISEKYGVTFPASAH